MQMTAFAALRITSFELLCMICLVNWFYTFLLIYVYLSNSQNANADQALPHTVFEIHTGFLTEEKVEDHWLHFREWKYISSHTC